MREVLCVVFGLGVGAFFGVTVMCILQINRVNQYENKIKQLEKQLNVRD